MKTSLKQSSWIVRLLEKQSELQAMVNPGHSLFFPELLKIKMVRIDLRLALVVWIHLRTLMQSSVFFGKDSKKAVCWSLELFVVTCMFMCIVWLFICYKLVHMYIIQIITEFRIYFPRDFGVEGLSSILLEMKSWECFFFCKDRSTTPPKKKLLHGFALSKHSVTFCLFVGKNNYFEFVFLY